MLVIATAAALLIPLNGCGGSGGGTAVVAQSSNLTIMNATGKVTLPPGFKGTLTGMTVQSGVDNEPVSANGTFKVQVVGPGEVPVYLLNSGGVVVLMGYADGGTTGSPEAGGNGQISALKTAESMLFTGLGGALAPPASWSNLLADILQTPQVTQLATTVAARVVANPTAISSGDTALYAAANTACTAILPAGTLKAAQQRPYPASTQQNGAFHVTVEANPTAPQEANQNLILVQPSAEQGGIDILNSLVEPGTIQFQNHYRRRAAAFIYKTATQVSGGDLTTVTPTVLPSGNLAPLVAQVSAGLDLSVVGSDLFEIEPCNALNKFPALIGDILVGSTAFTPKKSEPISLPLAPGTIRTDYTIVLVGTGNDNAFIPFEDPTPPAMAKEWYDAVGCLAYETMILDILVPVVASRPFPGTPAWSSLSGNNLGEIAHLLSAVPDIVTDIESGQYKSALHLFLDEVSPVIAEQILTAIWSQSIINGTFKEQLQIAEHELKGFFAVINTVNFVTAFVDASGVIYSGGIFNSYISWSATVVTKGGRLNPPTATVTNANPSVLLTAGPGGTEDPKAPYYYHFSVSGEAGGSLENSLGTSGRLTTLDTTNNQVQYLVSINAVSGRTDTVSVVIYQNEGTAAKPVQGAQIGTADSIVTVKLQTEGPCGLIPGAWSTGGPGLSVSPGLVAPGGTVTISMSVPGGTTSTCNFGQNGDVFVQAVTCSDGTLGNNHTWPAGDPESGGFIFNLTGGTSGQTYTMTVTLATTTPEQCPTIGKNMNVADLGGVWVTGFDKNGVSAAPIEIVPETTNRKSANVVFSGSGKTR